MAPIRLADRIRAFVRTLKAHPFLVVPPLFYLYTCGPTIGFGDTALHVGNIERFLMDSHVNTHPMMVLFGWFFSKIPVGNLAYRANLLSVFFGSATLIVFYLFCWSAFRSRLTASLAAGAFMVSHAMWWHSTLIEIYAINALLTITAIWLFSRARTPQDWRPLAWTFFVGGLSIFNHVQMAFLCVGAGFALISYMVQNRGDALRAFGRCAVYCTVGFLPWTILVIRDSFIRGSLGEALRQAFFGNFQHILLGGSWARAATEMPRLVFQQFPSAFLLLILPGMVVSLRRWKEPGQFGIWVYFLVNTWFFAIYDTWDQFAFLMPTWVMLAYFGALGMDAVFRTVAAVGTVRWAVLLGLSVHAIVFPVWYYGQFTTWAKDPDLPYFHRWGNSYSGHLYDQAEFTANPNKRGYWEVEIFAKRLFERLPPRAVFIDDDSRSYYQLAEYFQRLYKMRPDVSLVLFNSWGIQGWGASAGSITDLIVNAYLYDRPLFIAALIHPYFPMIEAASQRVPIEFKEFPLDEGRHVFRLVTLSERKQALLDGAMPPPRDVKPVLIRTSNVTFEPMVENVALAVNGSPAIQRMAEFGPYWKNRNQLFVLGTQTGAGVDLVLDSDRERKGTLSMRLSTARDFGLLQVYLNGDPVGQPVNLYSEQAFVKDFAIGEVTLSPTVNVLSLQAVGKDSRSTGFRFGVDTISFRQGGR